MSQIQDFRQKYPQYNDMTDQALADALHAKYYSDIPKPDFYNQVGLSLVDQAPRTKQPDGMFPTLSAVTSRGQNAFLMGAADEIGGAMAAVPTAVIDQLISLANPDYKPRSVGEAYRGSRDQMRNDMRYAEENAPIASLAADVTGGLATPAVQGAATAMAQAPSLLMRVGSGARDAALIGGASGFASAEGGLAERGEGAAAGALTGAALGALLPAGVTLAGPTLKTLQNVLGRQNPREEAVRQVLRALERDGMTPTQAAQFMRDARKGSPNSEMALVDSGPAMNRLGRMAETVPSQGSRQLTQFLKDRQLGQPERATEIVESVLGGEDYRKTYDTLNVKRKSDSAPLYERANAKTGVWNDRIKQFLDDPVTVAGLRKGVEIQRLEALAEGRPFDPNDLAVTGFNDAGDPILGGVPNMRTLDTIKRGMDEILEGYRDKTSGRLVLDQKGRAIDQVRRSFLKAVDDVNPDFAAARASWAGPSRSMSALQSGRSFASGNVDDMDIKFRDLETADRDFFKLGVVQAIKDQIDRGSDSREVMNRVFGPRHIRNRLRVLFDSADEFQGFIKAIENEARTTQTKNVVTSGSATGRIAAEQDDAASDVATDAALGFASGGLKGMALGLANKTLSRVRGINEPTADELAKLLTEQKPSQVSMLRKSAKKEVSRQELNRLVQRYLLLGGSAAAGGQLGGAASE